MQVVLAHIRVVRGRENIDDSALAARQAYCCECYPLPAAK
jgi:hypothetical protein